MHRTGWCGNFIKRAVSQQHDFHDWCCLWNSTICHHSDYFRTRNAVPLLAMDVGNPVVRKPGHWQIPISATSLVRDFDDSRRFSRNMYGANLAWRPDVANQCFMDEVYQRRSNGCLATDVPGCRFLVVGSVSSKPCKKMVAIFKHGLVQCDPAHSCCSVTYT